MYTSSSIANSQRMLTEMNKSGALVRVKIFVETDTVKYLKTSKVISSAMSISLSWFKKIIQSHEEYLLRYSFHAIPYYTRKWFEFIVFFELITSVYEWLFIPSQ